MSQGSDNYDSLLGGGFSQLEGDDEESLDIVILDLHEQFGGIPELVDKFGPPPEFGGTTDNAPVMLEPLSDAGGLGGGGDDSEEYHPFDKISGLKDEDEFDGFPISRNLEPEVFEPYTGIEGQKEFEAAWKVLSDRIASIRGFDGTEFEGEIDSLIRQAIKPSLEAKSAGYKLATANLESVHRRLDELAPQFLISERNQLSAAIDRILERDGDVLDKEQRVLSEKRHEVLKKSFDSVDTIESQIEELRELRDEVRSAVSDRLNALSNLIIDYERPIPLVSRAVTVESPKTADLVKLKNKVDEGFAGQYAKSQVSVEEMQNDLAALSNLASEVLKSQTMEQVRQRQAESLPGGIKNLATSGRPLGSGAFGEVFALKSDGKTALVGKCLDKVSPEYRAAAIKDMEHERDIYALLGDHPNICKCYGIHDVGTQKGKSSMLVLEKIEGDDLDKVFDKLQDRYSGKKGVEPITRTEYLGCIQHLIRDTLKGLSHMESVGLTHKDVKADNIKIDLKTGHAVLIDMGIAQESGGNKDPRAFWTIAPPEHIMSSNRNNGSVYKDNVVTSVWDSFTVGKMLFEEMERNQAGEKHMFAPGNEPIKGSSLDISSEDKRVVDTMQAQQNKVIQGVRATTKRKGESDFEALKDESGEYVGIALRKGEGEDAVAPGKFGVMSSYVDFMNRLTHPDPKQRLTPTEALKHPFMRDSILDEEAIKKTLGIKEQVQPIVDDKGKGEEDDKGKGEEIDESIKGEKKASRSKPGMQEDEPEESVEKKPSDYDPITITEPSSKSTKNEYDPIVESSPSSKSTKNEYDPIVESSPSSKSTKNEYDPIVENSPSSKSTKNEYDPIVESSPSSKSTKNEYDPIVDEPREK